MTYRFLEHTADVKFCAEGKTIEEMFSFAVDALKETICGSIKVLEKEERAVEVGGQDLEGLMYNFLEEFLVLLDAEGFLLSRVREIEIDVKKFKLKAVIVGDKAEDYNFTNDVKAVTYNEMFVKFDDVKKIWGAQVVLDV